MFQGLLGSFLTFGSAVALSALTTPTERIGADTLCYWALRDKLTTLAYVVRPTTNEKPNHFLVSSPIVFGMRSSCARA